MPEMSVELRADEDCEQWVQFMERSELYERAKLEEVPGFGHADYAVTMKAVVDADLHEDITAGSSKLYRLVNVVGVSAGVMRRGATGAILKRVLVFAMWPKVRGSFDCLNLSPEEARALAKDLLVKATSRNDCAFIKQNIERISDGEIAMVEVNPGFFERCLKGLERS
jgi:hypothetical protein